MPSWTSEQNFAITHNGGLLVSAAAGSGKTAVLTERIARLVADGAEAGDLLCVTFTNLAAAEMKKRIEKRLLQAAKESECLKTRSRLHRAAMDINRANISTMHSFCAQILKKYFYAANLDPAFRVADDAEVQVLKQETFIELAETRYTQYGGRFYALIEALGGSDEKAAKYVLALYDKIMAEVDTDAFLHNAAARYEVTKEQLSGSRFEQIITNAAKNSVYAMLCRYAEYPKTIVLDYPKLADYILAEAQRAKPILQQETLVGLAAAAVDFSAVQPRISWRGVGDAVRAEIEPVRKALKEEIKKLTKIGGDMEKEAAKINRQRPLIEELCATIKAFDELYAQKKSERALIDYADMEHKALRLLQEPEISQTYKNRFKYVFIDEYQDTNPVQEEILRAVSTESSLFLVGDVKQSIYRFRMAEPMLFLNRYKQYTPLCELKNEPDSPETDEVPCTRVDLNANFRSSDGVVNAINQVFSNLMHGDCAELEYDAAAALVHGRTEAQEPTEFSGVELLIIDRAATEPFAMGEAADAEEDTDEDEPAALATAELEAAAAARKILHIMEHGELTDEKTGEVRKPKFSDFAVLLRSPRTVAQTWAEVLAFCSIPAYAELTGGFFEAVEVQVFISLLKIIDNKRRNVAFAAVLRSPIGNFSTLELAELRARFGKNDAGDSVTFAESVAQAAAEPRGSMSKRCKLFLDKLKAWKQLASLVSTEELCTTLADETGFLDYCRALPGGKQRAANLEALFSKARSYESLGARGLHAFLTFMDKVKSNASLGAAETVGFDVVRIMSIHKSKGLEFPYVILGGITHSINQRDAMEKVVIDSELGIGAKLTAGGVRTDTLYHRAIGQRIREKNLAEELRVLYVGMTRAREHLVLVGATKNAESDKQKAMLYAQNTRQIKGNNFLHFLLTSLFRADDELHIKVSEQKAFGTAFLDRRLTKAQLFEELEACADAEPLLTNDVFEWRYMHDSAINLPSKVSVSELVGADKHFANPKEQFLEQKFEAYSFENEPAAGEPLHGSTAEKAHTSPKKHLTEKNPFLLYSEPAAPDFSTELTAAERGSAAHLLMERMPLCAHTVASAQAAALRLHESGLLTKAEVTAINYASIAAFFASDLGKRLINSPVIRRELTFTYRINVSEALNVVLDNEYTLLQGVIDCCFIENERWIIMDYKTDNVSSRTNLHIHSLRHQRQLALYCKALENISKIPVAKAYIVYLKLGESVCVVENT